MHVDEYSSSDREVIRFLFVNQDWADLYQLHFDFKLSPAQLVDIVERLVAADLAEMEDSKARLTPSGRKWVVEARRAIFFGNDRRDWQPRRDDLIDSPLEASTPYLPSLRLVDREFFVELAIQKITDSATNR